MLDKEEKAKIINEYKLNDFDKGRVDKSLDKQFVRDYLTSIGWNKEPPPPSLPKDVIEETSQRYLKIYELLTGNNL